MNPHAETLKLLEKYQGGRFVPKNPVDHELPLVHNGSEFRWYCGWEPMMSPVLVDFHAHAHIELAAWRAVREWCWNKGCWLSVLTFARDISLMACSSDSETLLGFGPDDPSALLVALTHITGATND